MILIPIDKMVPTPRVERGSLPLQGSAIVTAPAQSGDS